MAVKRFRQVRNEDGSFGLVERGQALAQSPAINVGDFEPYRSPIDGTLVSSVRQHEEHKRRHGVVELREFGDEFFDRKRKERERLYRGERSRQEALQKKQEINEIINHFERQR